MDYAWILESYKLKLQFNLAAYLLWPWLSYVTFLYYSCFLYKKSIFNITYFFVL